MATLPPVTKQILAAALGAGLAATAGCASDRGRPDEELGGLVVSTPDVAVKVDSDAAAGDIDILLSAARLPHRHVSELVGPHTFRSRSSLTLSRAGTAVEELSDESSISVDAAGNFTAIADNSRDYGRHAVFVEGTLYLRPRFGKYHKRAPEHDGEPAAIRDDIYATLGDYFEPLAARAEVTDGGSTTTGGRPARQIKVKTAPDQRPPALQSINAKKWRELAVVEKVEGSFNLDAETGVPLEATLTGTLSFVRGGDPFTLELTVQHEIADIGSTPLVVAPADDNTVSTFTRRTEVLDREHLLRGIAPPARKAPTPKNPTGEATAAPTGSGD